MSHRWKLVLLLGVGLTARPGHLACQQATEGFDHAKHRKVSASCIACHLGAVEAGEAMLPDPASCATCHDGTIQKKVAWQPRREPAPSNLQFDHAGHARAATRRPAACVACHEPQGASWMAVAALDAGRCVACHDPRIAHLFAPDTACATCHVPLVRATRLTVKDIAGFPTPPSHDQPGYDGADGHGAAAKVAGANCATCHARDFCLQCHVDAPERPAIQALATDARSTAIRAKLKAPPNHDDPGFLARHGTMVERAPGTCNSCHTRESCLTCHSATTRAAAALPAAGPGRGIGAVITRRRPPSHGQNYAERHASAAAASPAACAACHSRSDCLECHRPDAARAAGYHPPGFLTRHPASAYARETNCSDCHNTPGFCTTCHASAGLVAKGGQLRRGYHDFSSFFSAGHGQAARQSLETCVGCHVENDCLTCHSALGARRVNPHGPGFDAERLRKKNPQMCSACHGTSIPTQ